MDIREEYIKIGGNIDNILNRLKTVERVVKFLTMFLKDETFSNLERSLKEEDYGSAFMAAHTLKGIALNLDFMNFHKQIDILTELLRNKDEVNNKLSEINDCFLNAKKEYEFIIQFVNNLEKEV